MELQLIWCHYIGPFCFFLKVLGSSSQGVCNILQELIAWTLENEADWTDLPFTRLGMSPLVIEHYKRQTEPSEGGISSKIKVVFNALALRQGREHLKPKEH